MNYQLTVRRDAEQDITEYFQYYERIRKGLGHDFILCIEDALSKIERHPMNYKIIYKQLRRIAIKRFLHRIFYLVKGPKVIVIAVLHARKDPKSWNDRL